MTYASVIEPHGEYNPTVEYTLGSHSRVASVNAQQSGDYEYVRIETKAGDVVKFLVANNQDKAAAHTTDIDGTAISWTGPYHVIHSKTHTP